MHFISRHDTILNIIETSANILEGIGVFFITAYAFWLTYFSKNIKVTSTGMNYSRYFGSSINCTIVNKTLSPLIIDEIRVVYDNKYELPVKKFDAEPLVIEGFRAQNIEGDKFTKLSKDVGLGKDVYFKIVTPEKILHVKFRGKIKKNAKLETIGTHTNKFDGVVLTDIVKYVLIYWRKGESERKKIYITKDGFMDKELKNFNALPKEIMDKPNEMVELFKQAINDENYCILLEELEWK